LRNSKLRNFAPKIKKKIVLNVKIIVELKELKDLLAIFIVPSKTSQETCLFKLQELVLAAFATA